MPLLPDWKWKLAVTILVVTAAAVLFWPLPDPPPPPPPTAESGLEFDPDEYLHYTVQYGDTIRSIAHLFVVPQSDLRRCNSLGESEEPELGQVLLIPPSGNN